MNSGTVPLALALLNAAVSAVAQRSENSRELATLARLMLYPDGPRSLRPLVVLAAVAVVAPSKHTKDLARKRALRASVPHAHATVQELARVFLATGLAMPLRAREDLEERDLAEVQFRFGAALMEALRVLISIEGAISDTFNGNPWGELSPHLPHNRRWRGPRENKPYCARTMRIVKARQRDRKFTIRFERKEREPFTSMRRAADGRPFPSTGTTYSAHHVPSWEYPCPGALRDLDDSTHRTMVRVLQTDVLRRQEHRWLWARTQVARAWRRSGLTYRDSLVGGEDRRKSQGELRARAAMRFRRRKYAVRSRLDPAVIDPGKGLGTSYCPSDCPTGNIARSAVDEGDTRATSPPSRSPEPSLLSGGDVHQGSRSARELVGDAWPTWAEKIT